jgi:hypothetical protein
MRRRSTALALLDHARWPRPSAARIPDIFRREEDATVPDVHGQAVTGFQAELFQRRSRDIYAERLASSSLRDLNDVGPLCRALPTRTENWDGLSGLLRRFYEAVIERVRALESEALCNFVPGQSLPCQSFDLMQKGCPAQ